jgi:hypothetical protein
MRTTISIDDAVLDLLRERAGREGKSVGRLASELLTIALQHEASFEAVPLVWLTRPMDALADLDDPEAVRRAMDGRGHSA